MSSIIPPTIPLPSTPPTLLFLLTKSSEQEDRSDINSIHKQSANQKPFNPLNTFETESPLTIPLSHKPLSVTNVYYYLMQSFDKKSMEQDKKKQEQDLKKLLAVSHESLIDKEIHFESGSKLRINGPHYQSGVPDISEDVRFQFFSKGHCIESTFSELHLDNEENLTIDNHYIVKLATQIGFKFQKHLSFHFYHGKLESFDVRLARHSSNRYLLEIKYLPTLGLSEKFWKDVISNIIADGWIVKGPNLSNSNSQPPMLVQQYYSLLFSK